MNDNAKKWVEALRSGEFTQAAGFLRDTDTGGYCCLGVACEVYRRETGSGEWKGGGICVHPSFDDGEDSSNMSLPDGVQAWLGILDGEGYVGTVGDDGQTVLSGRNDAGVTFAEIADLIERDPTGFLFEPGGGPSGE